MYTRIFIRASLVIIILIGFLSLTACNASALLAKSTPSASAAPTVTSIATRPDWFDIKMTDVRTDESFSINDFAGKVVLVETMAEWCPNCVAQEDEVKKLEDLLSNPDDLVAISLDTDLNEDAASLKEYAETHGYDWYFAISPLEVDRALSNLYSAEYMNPPLTPMLFIDRQGRVYGLPFGRFKGAVSLQLTLAPYLAQ